jgi:hypothetical protein
MPSRRNSARAAGRSFRPAGRPEDGIIAQPLDNLPGDHRRRGVGLARVPLRTLRFVSLTAV